MGLFDETLSGDESLFVNELALDAEFLPKNLPHRENQQQYLAECIKPLLQKRNGKNLLIIGPSGIGKTAAAKFVLREMEERGLDEEVFPIYVNCWKKDTAYKMILDICEQVGFKHVFNKKADELIKDATTIINKKAAVFIFDEVDKLESQQIIYQLIEDVYRKSIFLITNTSDWMSELDQRIKSRLIPEILEFKPYNHAETEDILKKRINYSFVKGVWNEEALTLIVEKTAEIGDIRSGLFLLKEAGLAAEKKSSKKILVGHAEEAISKLPNFGPKKAEGLSEEEKELISLIKNNNGKSTAQIYEVYSKNSDKSYRTFQRKIKELEEAGFLNVETKPSEKGGKTSVVKTKQA
ncbi:AAA family ATPase [Candidatus Woesearchaeota archaeon]|nr:AAA family ATPase [Candidatus Woesearchaeota archaeon]